MHFPIATTPGPVFLLLSLFSSEALSEIVGCDAVGCPVDQYRVAQCELGNATLKAVGIANVTTTVDSRPFTWTLGLQENQSGDDGTQATFDRNFYLGTPSSVQLNYSTGCALFFEGIAPNLTAPKDKMDSFSCSDVLNGDCLSELILQAQTAAKDSEASKDADFCNDLRDSLIDMAPSTCNGVKESWGAIVARRE